LNYPGGAIKRKNKCYCRHKRRE